MEKTNQKWGFLRETKELAQKAGIDKDTGLHRTGLEEYLAVIYPGKDWIHNKGFGKQEDGISYRIRPDYRCEELKLIIEFDGVFHYQRPEDIKRDRENQAIYEGYRYKVVRIPYFVQLTNEVILQMFGVKIDEPMFDPSIASMGIGEKNTPAYCCPAGLKRMAEELQKYPQQMKVNIKALEDDNDDILTGLSLLEEYLPQK